MCPHGFCRFGMGSFEGGKETDQRGRNHDRDGGDVKTPGIDLTLEVLKLHPTVSHGFRQRIPVGRGKIVNTQPDHDTGEDTQNPQDIHFHQYHFNDL